MFCARPRKDLLSLGRRIVRAITHTTVSRDYFLAFLLLEPSVKWRLLLESVRWAKHSSQPYCSGYKLAFGSFTKLTGLRRVAESQIGPRQEDSRGQAAAATALWRRRQAPLS